MEKELKAFERLLLIMNDLREKCPWDRKQTMESLRHLTIEETYELTDAILAADMPEIKKELGDVLLHIVFYAKIASETNDFTITDVMDSLCKKLIDRHPHIYGDVQVKDEEEVKQNWEKLKLKEGKESVLSGVPRSLPSLIKALRMQDKAAQVGFDWPDVKQVWDKIDEEMGELRSEVNVADKARMEDEMGDLLFAVINLARHLGINPDDALEKTNNKFINRFRYIEQSANNQGKNISELTLDQMEVFWQEAKGK